MGFKGGEFQVVERVGQVGISITGCISLVDLGVLEDKFYQVYAIKRIYWFMQMKSVEVVWFQEQWDLGIWFQCYFFFVWFYIFLKGFLVVLVFIF